MKLPNVVRFLESCQRAHTNTEETWMQVQCPFCGDSTKSNHGHLSIRIEVNEGEPMVYQCFRADCGVKGVLTSDTLRLLGCTDTNALMELNQYNNHIGLRAEKGFSFDERSDHQYALVNLSLSDNDEKLDYINRRLGTQLDYTDLDQFKIQLGLYEFLRVNSITSLAFKQKFCNILDRCTIGFLSMYSDYLICRDITPTLETGNRYTMYRIRGRINKKDMKLYSIPQEIDLLDPHPVDVNIAEGPFSILGAYLHTKYGRTEPNSIWLANCGSGYTQTIRHLLKQYGFLLMNLHFWSDSEVKLKKYQKVLQELGNMVYINSCTVYYNSRAEDFGVPKQNIKVDRTVLI